MRGALSEAQALKTLWITEHLTSLRGQGDDLACKRLLPGHADLKDLLGFLASGKTAEGRQTKGDSRRILGLTHAVLLGHPKQRFDGIGADRQTDVIEPECRGGLELEVKIGAKLLTQGGRGHAFNQRLALGAAVVREPLHLENLLALKQAQGIGSKALDEGFAGGQLIQTSPQLGSGRTRLGAPRWRELEHPIGPGEQAVYIHKACLGAHLGRCQTRQDGVLELA